MTKVGLALAVVAIMISVYAWPQRGDLAEPEPATVPLDTLTVAPIASAVAPQARSAPPSWPAFTLPEPVPGDCSTYAPHIAAAGLPDVFVDIAWRESGCDHTMRVVDANDVSAGLLQLNFHANTGSYWHDLCGITWETATDALDLQLACAKAGYDELGMAPWEG